MSTTNSQKIDTLLLCAEIYTICGLFFENGTQITKVCPNSLLYYTLPTSVLLYFYIYHISKLNVKLSMNILNSIILFSCAIFFLIEICSVCDHKLTISYTYFATVCNFGVISWFCFENVKKIVEKYGINENYAELITESV